MKKLTLFFGFALMGVLFFACQKDVVSTEANNSEINTELSINRTANPCDYAYCDFNCLDSGQCCCWIEWRYKEDSQLTAPPAYRPRLCYAKDILHSQAECEIECGQTTWVGLEQIFCHPFTLSPPYPSIYTHFCGARNTGAKIYNPQLHLEVELTVYCKLADGTNIESNNFTIPPGGTIKLSFEGNCQPTPDC